MAEYEVNYADGYWIEKDGEAVIDFPDAKEKGEFAEYVCKALNDYAALEAAAEGMAERLEELKRTGESLKADREALAVYRKIKVSA